MTVAMVQSRSLAGVAAPRVTVEVHIAGGLPGVSVVGLPDAEVREARDRVRAALQNSRFEFPARKVTVSLAPADLRKESGRFDLPIALGILAATGQIPSNQLSQYEFAGELALTGDLRPVRGALAMARSAQGDGHAFMLPAASAAEAALVRDATVFGAPSLLAVCAHLAGSALLAQAVPDMPVAQHAGPDIADVRGQAQAKRVLEIAAAGAHSLLLIGPPGTGKSMLAQRLPSLLPALSEAEALEVSAVASIAGRFIAQRWGERPFRAPHHTASGVALVGGGSDPRPGEISLAHHGVLFLDELPEWERRVLEALREPLESGVIHISRAARQSTFPAQFQLVAAMNPCPCGWLGHPSGRCHCTPDRVARYRWRVSGPLLDRIDLAIGVPGVPPESLALNGQSSRGQPHDATVSEAEQAHVRHETSATIRARVERARERQLERQQAVNARLQPADVARHCVPEAAAEELLAKAMTRLALSARAYHRVLKVARTIADLAGCDRIDAAHVAEAIGYRRMDAV